MPGQIDISDMIEICPSDEGGYTWYYDLSRSAYNMVKDGMAYNQLFSHLIPDPARTRASGGVVSKAGRALWADSLRRRAK